MSPTVTTVKAIPADQVAAVDAALAGFQEGQVIEQDQVQAAVDAVTVAYDSLGAATLEGFVKLGEWLYELQCKIGHGAWQRCFNDSPHPIARPLPFSYERGRACIRLTTHPAILNRANWPKIPASWRTADEILRAADRLHQPVQDLIDSGRIYRTITRAEVEAFGKVVKPKRRRRSTAGAVTLDRIADSIEALADAYLVQGGNEAAFIRMLRNLADAHEDRSRDGVGGVSREVAS